MFTNNIGGNATSTHDPGWVNKSFQENATNAFENVPLSDNVYGLLGCVLAEMLHGTGLLKYMFGCLEGLIALTRSRKKDRESFDDLLRCIIFNAQCKVSETSHICP